MLWQNIRHPKLKCVSFSVSLALLYNCIIQTAVNSKYLCVDMYYIFFHTSPKLVVTFFLNEIRDEKSESEEPLCRAPLKRTRKDSRLRNTKTSGGTQLRLFIFSTPIHACLCLSLRAGCILRLCGGEQRVLTEIWVKRFESKIPQITCSVSDSPSCLATKQL